MGFDVIDITWADKMRARASPSYLLPPEVAWQSVYLRCRCHCCRHCRRLRCNVALRRRRRCRLPPIRLKSRVSYTRQHSHNTHTHIDATPAALFTVCSVCACSACSNTNIVAEHMGATAAADAACGHMRVASCALGSKGLRVYV